MVARTFGGNYRLEIKRGYPVTYNDLIVVGWLRHVGSELLGKDQVGTVQKTIGAEDFSFMTQVAKGAMFRLASNCRKPNRVTYTPRPLTWTRKHCPSGQRSWPRPPGVLNAASFDSRGCLPVIRPGA